MFSAIDIEHLDIATGAHTSWAVWRVVIAVEFTVDVVLVALVDSMPFANLSQFPLWFLFCRFHAHRSGAGSHHSCLF